MTEREIDGRPGGPSNSVQYNEDGFFSGDISVLIPRPEVLQLSNGLHIDHEFFIENDSIENKVTINKDAIELQNGDAKINGQCVDTTGISVLSARGTGNVHNQLNYWPSSKSIDEENPHVISTASENGKINISSENNLSMTSDGALHIETRDLNLHTKSRIRFIVNSTTYNLSDSFFENLSEGNILKVEKGENNRQYNIFLSN